MLKRDIIDGKEYDSVHGALIADLDHTIQWSAGGGFGRTFWWIMDFYHHLYLDDGDLDVD